MKAAFRIRHASGVSPAPCLVSGDGNGYSHGMTLRIISGSLRRRLLKTPPGKTTRPYTDRVRQIAFDRLGNANKVEGARVADVFSGVGTMGLEALSRGAMSCVFFEFDKAVHQALRENVSTLVPNHPTVCWRTNIHRSSFRPQGADECLPYTLVFFDPPYDQCPLLEPREPLGQAMKRLAKSQVTSSNATVVLRTPEKFELPEVPAWTVEDCWHISTMKLWILTKLQGSESSQAGQ